VTDALFNGGPQRRLKCQQIALSPSLRGSSIAGDAVHCGDIEVASRLIVEEIAAAADRAREQLQLQKTT
jgi:hypothetical protein